MMNKGQSTFMQSGKNFNNKNKFYISKYRIILIICSVIIAHSAATAKIASYQPSVARTENIDDKLHFWLEYMNVLSLTRIRDLLCDRLKNHNTTVQFITKSTKSSYPYTYLSVRCTIRAM